MCGCLDLTGEVGQDGVGWGVQHTSLQQHADGARVIGQCGVVKRRATTETSPAAEPAAEFILSGHQDCRDRGREDNKRRGDKKKLAEKKRSEREMEGGGKERSIRECKEESERQREMDGERERERQRRP